MQLKSKTSKNFYSFFVLFLLITFGTLLVSCNDHTIDTGASASSSSSSSVDIQTNLFIASLYSTSLCVNLGGAYYCSFGGFIQDWGGISTPSTWVPIYGFSNSVAAAAFGALHQCAIVDPADVQCWGLNTYHQLGDGTTTQNFTPTTVNLGGGNAVSLAVGDYHNCVALDDGTVKCWGADWEDQAGVSGNSGNDVPTPTLVLMNASSSSSALSSVTSVTAGNGFSCALIADGSVRCWGNNGDGELGDNQAEGSRAVASNPVLVGASTPMTGASSICSGLNYSCALLTNNTVDCWGYSGSGQIGDNDSSTDAYMATPVLTAPSTPLTDVAAISCGYQHACAVSTGGALACWGDNTFGELGNGQSGTQSTLAVQATEVSGSPVVAFSAGGNRTCFIQESLPAIQCFGHEVNLNGSDSLSAVDVLDVYISGSSSPSALGITPIGPTLYNDCFPVDVYTTTSDPRYISTSVSSAVTVDLSATSGTFYTDSGCSSSTSSATISEGNSLTTLYYSLSTSSTTSVGMQAEDQSSSLSSSPVVEVDVYDSGC